MVGKITKTILLTKDHNELQRIYDRYPGKCKQWNAAFMINKATPDSVKDSIKRDAPEVFEMFTCFKPGQIVVSAFTDCQSNYWDEDKVLSVVKINEVSQTFLENGCYFDREYPGFCPSHVALFKTTTCVGESLPEPGLYWIEGKGFVMRDEYDDVIDSDGNDVSESFQGHRVSRVYSAEGLFDVFQPEEQMFEQLMEDLERSQAPEIWPENPPIIVETLAQLFSEEVISESVEEKVIS